MIVPHRQIAHVTLTTGHTRLSSRSEVSDEAIDACRCLLAACVLDGGAAIPHVGPYVLRVSGADTRCLTATVHRLTNDVLMAYGPPLVTIGVAKHSRCGAALWARLGGAGDQPLTPWCAVRLEPALAAEGVGDGAPVHWLGDFERCLAWAWIAR